MLRTPPSSPLSGRSSQVLLLVIAGLGTSLLLVFLFTRVSSTRAAASVEPVREPAAAAPDPVAKSAPRPVELPSPAEIQVPAALANDGGNAAAGLAALAAAEAPASEAAPVPANAKAAVEGPKLTYAKREGKRDVIRPGEMRQRNKEKTKQRLEQATERAIATGKTLPEPLRKKAEALANGEKPVRPNPKGKRGKNEAKPKPADG